MRIAVAVARASSWRWQAFACGYCVEDKIAATYDHAVVVRALEHSHHVAFFHIDGVLPSGEGARRTLAALAESAAGVEKGSVRVSLDTLTLSFAFDPQRSSLGAASESGGEEARFEEAPLMPLRVMERAADLKVPKKN